MTSPINHKSDIYEKLEILGSELKSENTPEERKKEINNTLNEILNGYKENKLKKELDKIENNDLENVDLYNLDIYGKITFLGKLRKLGKSGIMELINKDSSILKDIKRVFKLELIENKNNELVIRSEYIITIAKKKEKKGVGNDGLNLISEKINDLEKLNKSYLESKVNLSNSDLLEKNPDFLDDIMGMPTESFISIFYDIGEESDDFRKKLSLAFQVKLIVSIETTWFNIEPNSGFFLEKLNNLR